jgi:Phosphotransferase enzyme family
VISLGTGRMTASAAAAHATTPLPPPEVVELAGDVLGGTSESLPLVAHERLKKSVHRLRFDVSAGPSSVVAKRLSLRRARANELVAKRWLPAAGLEGGCPDLRGVFPEPSGSAVWHVYEDIVGSGLNCGLPDPARVRPMVELIAGLHTRFVGHALLPECREHGEGLGIGFFTSHVARSVRFLRSLRSGPRARGHKALIERLLGQIERLDAERHERALLLETCGGPDTLLHGDLWTTNTLIVERPGGPRPMLIDWDHVGVGPVTYDLSTFLYRFPPKCRPWILVQYRQATARRGRQLPDDSILNLLFETAEYARYACCLAEAVLAASRGADWGFMQMEEIERWFTALEPVLAVDGG